MIHVVHSAVIFVALEVLASQMGPPSFGVFFPCVCVLGVFGWISVFDSCLRLYIIYNFKDYLICCGFIWLNPLFTACSLMLFCTKTEHTTPTSGKHVNCTNLYKYIQYVYTMMKCTCLYICHGKNGVRYRFMPRIGYRQLRWRH